MAQRQDASKPTTTWQNSARIAPRTICGAPSARSRMSVCPLDLAVPTVAMQTRSCTYRWCANAPPPQPFAKRTQIARPMIKFHQHRPPWPVKQRRGACCFLEPSFARLEPMYVQLQWLRITKTMTMLMMRTLRLILTSVVCFSWEKATPPVADFHYARITITTSYISNYGLCLVCKYVARFVAVAEYAKSMK